MPDMPETTVTLLASSVFIAVALIALFGGRAIARRPGTVRAEPRFDEQLETTRAALLKVHAGLDRGRVLLIAAAARLQRVGQTVRAPIRMLELRRAILG
jgi:hypothetical protein